MSLLGKTWKLLHQDEQNDHDLLAILLKNRGVTADSRDAFLQHTTEHLYDPFQLKDMGKAVERIQIALREHQPIMIFGDYDVDGITATALMYDYLKKNDANVSYTLPTRDTDGYGLKDYFVKRFVEQGIRLLITVDCGTASLHEIALARELGLDVIVVDHHQIPPQLPPALALINPHQVDCSYPFDHLCGSTLAYKVILALEKSGLKAIDDPSYYLSLVVMGLVADCMPLQSENRILAKAGLRALQTTNHPGLRALLEVASVDRNKVSAMSVGFYLAPRLNAAGRLETPLHSLELLLGQAEKAALLEQLNRKRQALVETYMEQALQQIDPLNPPPLLVLSSAEWRPGVLGLIASKMADRFHRPAIALSDLGPHLVASCRSVGDFDITAFLRREVGELFSAFGGHKQAGGFTLPKENWDAFQGRVQAAATSKLQGTLSRGELAIDCILSAENLHARHLPTIDCVGPFGIENPEPLFMIRNVKIVDFRPVGAQKQHLQFKVATGQKLISAIAFRFGEHMSTIGAFSSADVACHLDINEWNGYRNLQLKVVDIRQSSKLT